MSHEEEDWPSDDPGGPESRDVNIHDLNARLQADWEDTAHAESLLFAVQHLRRGGWPERLLDSDEQRIPVSLRGALIRTDPWPSVRYGLVGPVGCGKTCAMAAKALGFVQAARLRQGPAPAVLDAFGRVRILEPKPPPPVLYLNWPQVSLEIRLEAGAQRFKTHKTVQSWTDDPSAILVLDDLGAERIRESKGMDREILEVMVDTAYHHSRSLFWTSNMGPEELEDAYGGRFASRLLGLAPAIRLPRQMPDLRRVQRGAP